METAVGTAGSPFAFEAAIRSQQQSHSRIHELELELTAVVTRGAAIVRDLGAVGGQVRQAAETATRDASTEWTARLREFEQRGARVLDAYANAVRAAQQAVARAEARIEAFDERVGRELAQAGREIREAAELLRERAQDARSSESEEVPVRRGRWLIPALLAALLLTGCGAYSWLMRTLNDASARAVAAERQANEARQDATPMPLSTVRPAGERRCDCQSARADADRRAHRAGRTRTCCSTTARRLQRFSPWGFARRGQYNERTPNVSPSRVPGLSSARYVLFSRVPAMRWVVPPPVRSSVGHRRSVRGFM